MTHAEMEQILDQAFAACVLRFQLAQNAIPCRAPKRYLKCAQAGMTQAETSRHLGVSREAVSQIAMRHRLVFKAGPGKASA